MNYYVIFKRIFWLFTKTKLSKFSILDHFQGKNGHKSRQQSWITIKEATFDTSKKILGPVHLLPKTDKWDYLRSPIIEFFFVSCFDIGEVPRSPGKWNWNWLYFLPFIFTFEQCALTCFLLFIVVSTTYLHSFFLLFVRLNTEGPCLTRILGLGKNRVT